jgi:hypothetical protein
MSTCREGPPPKVWDAATILKEGWSEESLADARRQSLLVAEADANDPDLALFLEAAWADLYADDDWV